jgi:hypothetical protein
MVEKAPFRNYIDPLHPRKVQRNHPDQGIDVQFNRRFWQIVHMLADWSHGQDGPGAHKQRQPIEGCVCLDSLAAGIFLPVQKSYQSVPAGR